MNEQVLEVPTTKSENMLSWYAVRTYSNYEFRVNNMLLKKSFNVFYPTVLKWSRRRDRRKKIARPLFPGYLFVESDPYASSWLDIKKTEGVFNILSYKGIPQSMPQEEIDSVRKIIESGLDPRPHPFLNVGDMVIVVEGPLRGAIGIFKSFDDKKGTFIVSVNLLGRSIAVEIDKFLVERY